MPIVDHQALILSSICHIVATLARIERRLDAIEAVVEDDDAKEVADRLYDAADEIEGSDDVPHADEVARQLRDLAKEYGG